MANFFLHLGTINKNLLVPFFLALFSLIHTLYIEYILKKEGNVIITEISASIGHMSILIIPYLKCFSSKNKVNKIKKKKKIILGTISFFYLLIFCI